MKQNKELIEALKRGVKVVATGTSEGPYTTYITYFMSDGSYYTIKYEKSKYLYYIPTIGNI